MRGRDSTTICHIQLVCTDKMQAKRPSVPFRLSRQGFPPSHNSHPVQRRCFYLHAKEELLLRSAGAGSDQHLGRGDRERIPECFWRVHGGSLVNANVRCSVKGGGPNKLLDKLHQQQMSISIKSCGRLIAQGEVLKTEQHIFKGMLQRFNIALPSSLLRMITACF